MSDFVKICMATLPNGKTCGSLMEKFNTNDGYYYICPKCGNMR